MMNYLIVKKDQMEVGMSHLMTVIQADPVPGELGPTRFRKT